MASSLPFQYQQRGDDITKTLGSAFKEGDQIVLQRLRNLFERRDQDLENFLAKPGGTLATSFLAVADDWQAGSGSGNFSPASPYETLSFVVPNDPTFTYYLDWFVKTGDLCFASAGGNLWIQSFAQIKEQAPGAGFEKWGFQAFTPDGAVASAAPFGRLVVSGYGRRCEQISNTLIGTTIHLDVYLNIQSTVGTWNWNLGYGAKLLAIPV